MDLYNKLMENIGTGLKRSLNEELEVPYQMTNPISMCDFIEAWDNDDYINGMKVRAYCHANIMEKIKEHREEYPELYDKDSEMRYFCVFGNWDYPNEFVSKDNWDYQNNILGNKLLEGSFGSRGMGANYYYIYWYDHGYLTNTGTNKSFKDTNWLMVMDPYVLKKLGY